MQVGYGRYHTRSASFSAGFGGDHAQAAIAGSRIDSAEFPTRTGDTVDRGYESTSFTASASVGAGPLKLGLRAWYAEGTTEYSDFFVAPVDQDFENSTVALSADYAPTEAWTSRLVLAHAVDDLEQNQSADFLDTKRSTVDWQNDFVVGGHNTLTAGVLWQAEEAEAESFGLPYGSDTTTRQLYLQDQLAWARTACFWAPRTRITRHLAAMPPGMQNMDSSSPAAPCWRPRRAPDSGRLTRPISMALAAIPAWSRRRRGALNCGTGSWSAIGSPYHSRRFAMTSTS